MQCEVARCRSAPSCGSAARFQQRPGPGELLRHCQYRPGPPGYNQESPQYQRPCRRTICRQQANCFNLVSDPPRCSLCTAGAMDIVQEQLKRGREPEPIARPSQTVGDSESPSSQDSLGGGPSQPFQASQPLLCLPLKDKDFTLESEFGNQRQ